MFLGLKTMQSIDKFDQKLCVFCQHFRESQMNFTQLLNRALYSRYSADSDCGDSYCIDDLIEIAQKPWVIQFKDRVIYEETEEYLKRSYENNNLKEKLSNLLEYYKYHEDFPRLFIEKVYDIIEDFHEKYKEIKYYQVRKILGIPPEKKIKNQVQNEFSNVLQQLTFLRNRTQPSFLMDQNGQSSRFVLRDLISQIQNKQQEQQDFSITQSWFSMTRTDSQMKLQLSKSKKGSQVSIPTYEDGVKIQTQPVQSLQKVSADQCKKFIIQQVLNQQPKVPPLQTDKVPTVLSTANREFTQSRTIQKFNQELKQLMMSPTTIKQNRLQSGHTGSICQSPHTIKQDLFDTQFHLQKNKISKQQFKSMQEKDLKTMLKGKQQSRSLISQLEQQLVLSSRQNKQSHIHSIHTNTSNFIKKKLTSSCLAFETKTPLTTFQNKVQARNLSPTLKTLPTQSPIHITSAVRGLKSPTSKIPTNSQIQLHLKQNYQLGQNQRVDKQQSKNFSSIIQQESILEIYKKWQEKFSTIPLQLQKTTTSQQVQLKTLPQQTKMSDRRVITESSISKQQRHKEYVLTDSSPKQRKKSPKNTNLPLKKATKQKINTNKIFLMK